MVAAKTVSISSDDITYYVLPGNTGEFNNELGLLDDTIFGQPYKSTQAGISGWQIKSQAFWKGFAGYVATIKLTGTPTTMTAEACSLVSGKTYKITSATKSIIDPATALVVLDNAVDHTADVLSVDYVMGRVTFKSAYTVTAPVTVTGKYLPTTAIASAQSFTLTMTAEATDTTDFATAQANGGQRTFVQGLQTVSMEVKGFQNATNAWRTKLNARTPIVIDISPDGGGLSIMRGFFDVTTQNLSGTVGNIENESIKLMLQVPATANTPSLLSAPFSILHTSTTLATAVQKVLDGFLNATLPYVKYLPDGTNGVKGAGVVTDCSFSSGVDAMNQFTVNIQGSGALTTVGTGL